LRPRDLPWCEATLRCGATPLICCGVWEHAYYVDYRNARAKFLDTFLASLANWDFAASNYEKAGGK
jgi:Fe-Mn family superoxide dismutase